MGAEPLLRVDPDASVPLATQLSEQLAWLIASGRLKEGEQLPPVRNLAEDLQINLHTVRAAYRQLEANGLVQTRRGRRTTVLTYDRRALAIKSPNLPTFTIGVLVPNYSPYYAPFLQGIEQAAKDDPWLLFICDTHYYSRHVGRYMDQLVAKNVDGIIVTHFERHDVPELSSILKPSRGLPPMVYADSPGMRGPGVSFDRVGGSYKIVRHLIGHGHARIGLITPPIAWASMAEVYRGYEQALAESGLTSEDKLVSLVHSFSIENGAQAAERLLQLELPPTAILAAGDILAAGAMQAIKRRGLRIPDDVALAGYGEIDIAALLDPPLTTVSLPAQQMGIHAMQLLRQLIAGGEPQSTQVIIPTSLVIRESCGCPAEDEGFQA